MVKKLLGAAFASTLLLGAAIPAFAQTDATKSASNKAEVAACMASATQKQKAALTAARESYTAAVKRAKGREGKAARAKARQNEKNAKRAAKEAFAADRKACTAMAPKAEKTVTVSLAAIGDSGISGHAALKEENGKVKVTLELTGAPAGVSQPAHIHMGACPTPGAVKYPLTSAVGGKSETMLDVTLAQLKSELPLALNVHKSVSEAGVYVSCGDVKL